MVPPCKKLQRKSIKHEGHAFGYVFRFLCKLIEFATFLEASFVYLGNSATSISNHVHFSVTLVDRTNLKLKTQKLSKAAYK